MVCGICGGNRECELGVGSRENDIRENGNITERMKVLTN